MCGCAGQLSFGSFLLRVVAIIAIHNERPYLANCLTHLVQNGVEYAIIDNGSTDGAENILSEPRFAAGLVAVQHLPFTGVFDLNAQLVAKQRLAATLDADWFIHLDADEIMHSYQEQESLKSAIVRLDAQGWQVINFDEFVFLPVDANYVTDCEGMQPLLHYYFFEPKRPRLMRAWKATNNLSNVGSGGHILTGADFRLAPEPLTLRHYIFRDQGHAFEKYRRRQYSQAEIARGWHYNRVGQPETKFTFPSPTALERITTRGERNLRRDNPRLEHYWQW